MTELLFKEYLNNIWYPKVQKLTSENVCMTIDNCGAHGGALPEFVGMEHTFLSPNVTSLFQPMNMGNIAAIKRHTCKNMLSQMIQTWIIRRSHNELFRK